MSPASPRLASALHLFLECRYGNRSTAWVQRRIFMPIKRSVGMRAVLLFFVAGCGSRPQPAATVSASDEASLKQLVADKARRDADPKAWAAEEERKRDAALPAIVRVFAASPFCQQHGCLTGKTWPLRTGGMNHVYSLSEDQDVTIELPTASDGSVDSYAVTIDTEQPQLTERQLSLVEDFLKTIDASAASPATLRFVRKYIEQPASQIRLAESTDFGRYRLWAGRIGDSRTVDVGTDRGDSR